MRKIAKNSISFSIVLSNPFFSIISIIQTKTSFFLILSKLNNSFTPFTDCSLSCCCFSDSTSSVNVSTFDFLSIGHLLSWQGKGDSSPLPTCITPVSICLAISRGLLVYLRFLKTFVNNSGGGVRNRSRGLTAHERNK